MPQLVSNVIRQQTNINYRIKLLARNNGLVLIQADGYGAEIFIPQVHRGRITLQNVLPTRRCCKCRDEARERLVLEKITTKDLCTKPSSTATQNGVDCKVTAATVAGGDQEVPDTKERPPLKTQHQLEPQSQREAPQQIQPKQHWLTTSVTVKHSKEKRFATPRVPLATYTPQACSTPIPQARSDPACRTAFGHELRVSPILLSPDAARCTAHVMPRSYELAKDSVWHLPTSSKDSKKQSDAAVDPSITSLRATADASAIQGAANSPQQQSLFETNDSGGSGLIRPRTPLPQRSGPNQSQCDSEPKSPDSLQELLQRLSNVIDPDVDESESPPWLKNVNSIKTYSRKLAKPANRTVEISALEKIKPTYLVNPTQGRQALSPIKIKRKSRIVIDEETRLSRETLRRQQLEALGIVLSPWKLHSSADSEGSTPTKLPRTREEYEYWKITSFDLLTNSDRVTGMSDKLNALFRKGCVNKASQTNPMYKRLYFESWDIQCQQVDERHASASVAKKLRL